MPVSFDRFVRSYVVLAALLLVSFFAGASRADVLSVKDVLPPTGRIASSGATPVVIVAGTAGKLTVLAGAAIRNKDTIQHTVTITSSGGTVLREFDLPAAPGGALIDEVQNIQSLLGEGISMSIDAAGVSTSVVCTAQPTAR